MGWDNVVLKGDAGVSEEHAASILMIKIKTRNPR
jgi:hypothetical protein